MVESISYMNVQCLMKPLMKLRQEYRSAKKVRKLTSKSTSINDLEMKQVKYVSGAREAINTALFPPEPGIGNLHTEIWAGQGSDVNFISSESLLKLL